MFDTNAFARAVMAKTVYDLDQSISSQRKTYILSYRWVAAQVEALAKGLPDGTSPTPLQALLQERIEAAQTQFTALLDAVGITAEDDPRYAAAIAAYTPLAGSVLAHEVRLTLVEEMLRR